MLTDQQKEILNKIVHWHDVDLYAEPHIFAFENFEMKDEDDKTFVRNHIVYPGSMQVLSDAEVDYWTWWYQTWSITSSNTLSYIYRILFKSLSLKRKERILTNVLSLINLLPLYISSSIINILRKGWGGVMGGGDYTRATRGKKPTSEANVLWE